MSIPKDRGIENATFQANRAKRFIEEMARRLQNGETVIVYFVSQANEVELAVPNIPIKRVKSEAFIKLIPLRAEEKKQ